MLTHLSIRDVVLVDKLDIDFANGLCVLTGETGAGKSIILGALSLILGDRADTSILINKNEKSVIDEIKDIFHICTEVYMNHFGITKNEFSDVKKLSNINGDRIINISIQSGKIILSEKASWELELGSFDDDRNASLMLNKKFLSCINDDNEQIEFNIFENFMLIKDEHSNLMLSFEQSKLLQPEMVRVWDEDTVEFRGKLHKV